MYKHIRLYVILILVILFVDDDFDKYKHYSANL